MLKHHALRTISTLLQVHPLFVSTMTKDGELIAAGVNRIFGASDVRELRYLIRILGAALGHLLLLEVVPERMTLAIANELRRPQTTSLRDLLEHGGQVLATKQAGQHLFQVSTLQQVLTRCDKMRDPYSSSWLLWLVLTMMRNEDPASRKPGAVPSEDILCLNTDLASVDHEQLRRRAMMKQQLNEVGLGAKTQGADGKAEQAGGDGAPKCSVVWLRENPQLVAACARLACTSVAFPWKDAQRLGCATVSRMIFEFPRFLHTMVDNLKDEALLTCLLQSQKTVQLGALLAIANISAIKLSLNAFNLAADFLTKFHALQQVLLEGLAKCGEGPYDLIVRWLHEPPAGLPCNLDFRCIVAFMIGQCVSPPLAETPTLDPMGWQPSGKPGEEGPPPVAKCGTPPAPLLDKLAEETLKEEHRLREGRKEKSLGPLFSSMLCHLLFGLGVMVPLHPKAAANSAAVRGAAFSQLMKVQSILAQSVQPKFLFDPTDGDRQKLFLYIRATACIQCALQSITGCWFAADFGARFMINEEGGRDFILYCAKTINQAFTNKSAMTKVLGTPWERLMHGQGPTTAIAELFLMICASSDANLAEVSRLGGDQALHALSKYGDTSAMKQQATMLMTKLAVALKL